MNILVSDISNTYTNWVVLRSLKDVIGIVGNIDYLVYHKSKESSDEKIQYLNIIFNSKTSCKIIYLASKSNLDSAVKMLITGGFGGKYIDDEFFLESEEELNTLISDLSVISDSSELSSVSVLNDFFNRYMSDGSKGISRGYLQVVKSAAIKMTEEYNAKNLEILEMSESAAEIFTNSVEIISNMKESQKTLENSLSELKSKIADVDSMSLRQDMGSSIIYYPRITYMKNRVLIKIKDIGGCNYLMSFILGFREYLDKIKNIRPKLIVIEGLGKIKEEIYSKYNWVTTENKNDIRNFLGSVVFTNNPTSMVLNKLLDDMEFDTFIVLDRTNNYKDHILNSRGNDIYALSGKSFVKRFKLPISRCIFSTDVVDKSLLSIPYFSEYPDRDDQRVNKYLKDCSSSYELLYNSK